MGNAVKVFGKNTTSSLLLLKHRNIIRWRFFSKPVGLDLYSIVRLAEGSHLSLLSFFIFILINIQIMEHSISVKQILIDLISIMPQVEKEFKSNERYSQLVEFLSGKDYHEGDEPYPTLKDIAEKTGVKSHHIRKQLEEIYANLFAYDYDYTFDFSEVEIRMHVDYNKKYESFRCKELKYLPKIGESIQLPFLKAKIGIHFFYVQDVQHQFELNKQIITLFLKGGFYNSYWYYRKHKALELGEIGIGDEYKLYDFQLKEKLGLRG
ncbi:hypothetical protein C1T31_09820 [Hanstruepera neustonica]|uniref:Uncharacterized protein n=1 Tax=Hanstruepera neustonica TaxID=1445657 RepID=A0A2K1DXP9_9FLAO|nr:hypothetical protein [Hanstruepera neustonica]PNQ72798.1 hypothetical protein C1T31_09820 [Hanstruepera neustonica]